VATFIGNSVKLTTEVELMVDAFMNLNGTAKIVRLIKVIRYIFVGTLESYQFVTRISPS